MSPAGPGTTQRVSRGERAHAAAVGTVLLTILFGIGLAAVQGTLAEGANCTSYNGYGGYGSPLACQLATRPFVSASASTTTPFVDEPVTFTAVATIKSGRIVLRRWELNGDGQYDDADGLTAVRTFATPGLHRVTFKAIDRDGDEATTAVEVVAMARPVPPPPAIGPPAPPPAPAIRRQPSLQAVFVTRSARRKGTTLGSLEGLRVKAIGGARLNVVCIRSCGTLKLVHRVRTSPRAVSVTLRPPRRVALRKGATIEIRSAALGYAQRFERFVFRRTSIGVFARQVGAGCLKTQRPRRTERCPPA